MKKIRYVSDAIKSLRDGEKTVFDCLCLKRSGSVITVSARDDESYAVRNYDMFNFSSIDKLSERVEADYVISMIDNFGFIK